MQQTAVAGPIEDLSAGHWYKVPNSKLQSVLPSPVPPGYPAAITDAWNGGALDTRRARLIVWGGGHRDYAGNELYAFDINTLSWMRLTDPSDSSGGSEISGLYGDGNPRSTHTYSELAYSAATDRFYFIGMGSVWSSGQRSNRSGSYDFQTGQWSQITDRPDIGVPEAGVTAYDSATGRIWHQPGWTNQLTSYDTATNNWQTYSPAGGSIIDLFAVAAIDPERRLMVAVGDGQFFAWALDNPTSLDQSARAGPSNIEQGKAPGFAFDQSTNKFVGWVGGTAVYTFDPDAWTWERIEAATSNTVVPTNPNANGTYGRFQYIPSKNAFIVVNSIDQDVYIYKLSNGLGTGEETNPPPGPPPPPTGGDVPPGFEDLCGQQGVTRCNGFDSTGEITQFALPADDNVILPVLDSSVAATGPGSMRFEIPGLTSSNSSGSWLADLGHEFRPGETMYIMFRQRFSDTMLNINFGGSGWKQVIFHGQSASCASVELTTQNVYHRGFPQMYTDCGARAMDVDLGNGDFLLQQGDYECHFQNKVDCSFYRANQWMTFYWEIALGEWGTPTSHIRAYVAYEGGELLQYIDRPNFRLDYNDGPMDAYNRIQITPYHTGKDSLLNHATAYTWYDDLVVSTQPIVPTVPRNPPTPAPNPPSNLDVQ